LFDFFFTGVDVDVVGVAVPDVAGVAVSVADGSEGDAVDAFSLHSMVAVPPSRGDNSSSVVDCCKFSPLTVLKGSS